MDPLDLDSILLRTQEVTRDVIIHEAEAVDRDAIWPEKGLRAMQSAGLGGLVAPREFGGHGQGLLALTRVCEVIAQECASTAMCFGMHCVAVAVISAKATPLQHSEFLEPICAGRHLTSLALSEPGTGAHFYLPQTQIQLHDDEKFVVHGEKTFVTNGCHADSYVVSAKGVDGETATDAFSCVVLPSDVEGMEWGAPWSGLGMRGNSSCAVKLNGVKVPREYLLGAEGDQIWYVFNVVAPCFLLAMAGTYLGVAGAAFEGARSNLMKRRYAHSGETLAEQPVLQHQLGRLWIKVQRTRRLIYHAARSHDYGEPDAINGVLAAKAEVADCVVAVVNEAMTMTGGAAYRDGAKLQRLLRDARAAPVMSPTSDLLLLWLGRSLLDQPLLGS